MEHAATLSTNPGLMEYTSKSTPIHSTTISMAPTTHSFHSFYPNKSVIGAHHILISIKIKNVEMC